MEEIKLFRRGIAHTLIPLFAEKIHAGFESPSADYEEARIDLNDYVSKYPAATFFAKVTGECMVGSGIYPEDLLVVDKSLTPQSGDIVVGIIDNEFILRSYFITNGKEYLMPDNTYFKPIERTNTTHFEIWGVVPHSVLDQRRRNSARIIDSNNFYVSAERVFQPELRGKAGCVLSNNDGCAISGSNEAKEELGIKMGTPFFLMREKQQLGKMWWRLSNYPLYQDMMRRITKIVQDTFPDQEIYFIDECYCDLATFKHHDIEDIALKLRARILKFTGVPVCIGIGATKTF